MIQLIGEKLMRYDLNRSVEVAPRHSNELHEVRFSKNTADGEVVMPVREENGKTVADIPNRFLMDYGTLTVEVHSVDKTGRLDSERMNITVRDRAKPSDYQYEDNVPASGTGGGGSMDEDRLIQILSDTGAAEFASPDGDALYTDNENKIYCI